MPPFAPLFPTLPPQAGILLRELSRADLRCGAEWSSLIRAHGFCTMCPRLGKWLCTCFGRDRGVDTTMNTLKLKDIVEWVVPDGKIMGCQFHTAGADAQMHALVFIELAKLAQSTVSRG